MKPTTIVAALASIALLAACDTQTDPAQPPTSEPALTTATAAPPPPDDTQTTTTVAPTEEADGPPEMPEEATEQTEAGAEAFVGHYLDTYNHAFASADATSLEGFGSSDCESCAGLADSIPPEPLHDFEYLDVGLIEATLLGDTTRVTADVTQNEFDGNAEASGTALFTLTWVDDAWVIDGIQVLVQ